MTTPARLLVWVQPRASRTEVAGMRGDAVKIRLAAPPVDGAANEELIRFVAEMLGGRLVPVDTSDPNEHKLLNVVEEMAIASGTPVPPVYVLDAERGINA